LINQGLIKRSLSKGFTKDLAKQEKYSLFLDHIKLWCYSWITAFGCEDEDEYILLKELLFSYINSQEGLLACDGSQHAIQALDDWVRIIMLSSRNNYICTTLANSVVTSMSRH
jgi:hypothetical protein